MATRRGPSDRSVSPLISTAVVAVVVVLIGVKFWAADRAAAVAVPNDVRVAPDGRLGVLHGKSLYIGNPEVAEAQHFDLAPLGAGDRWANFDFFPDGDVLVWRTSGTAGLSQKLLEGLRTMTGGLVDATGGSNAQLARCDLKSRSCETFLDGGEAPRPPYGVAIGNDGTVYMSDTAEHRVLAYAPDGKELASFEQGLLFPNGLWLRGDRLWLANTEKREIVSVSTEPPLTEPVKRRDYERRLGTTELKPTALAPVGEQWWVVTIGDRLTGETVDRLDGDGVVQDSLALGSDAQPTKIVRHGDSVYVTDTGRLRVLRFARDGTPRGEIEWRGLQKDLAASRQTRTIYTWTGHAAWMLFIGFVGAGLVIGYRQGGVSAAGVNGVSLRALGMDASDPRIHWLSRANRFRLGRVGRHLIAAAFVLLAVFFAATSGGAPGVLRICGLMLVGGALMWFMLGPVFETSVGVFEGWLILDNGRRQSVGRGDAIEYTGEAVAIDDIAVPLGRSGQKIFREEEIDEHVKPLLERATPISKSRMQLRMMRSYPAASGVFAVALLGVLIWVGFYGPFV